MPLAAAGTLAACCPHPHVQNRLAYPGLCGPRPGGLVSSPAGLAFESLLESDEFFPLGVMAGDARSDRAVVWTRFAGDGELALRVLEVRGRRVVRVVFDENVRRDEEGYSHIDVSGLSPATRYVYSFVARRGGRDLARSPIGAFRTSPEEDSTAPVVFAASCCTRAWSRPFPAMRHAAQCGGLDFFVHLGDHVYADGSRALAEYRERYAENWASSGLRALHASTGLYSTWDDHEFANDFDPETLDRAVVANATRAYFEHHPIRRDPSAPDRVWKRVRWGRAVELFVLDCRSERRPSTRHGPDAEYISRAQMDWLKRGLRESGAVFKLVVTSVPISNYPGVFDLKDWDRWEGYRAQREELLDAVTAPGMRGVFFVAGDFHFGAVSKVEAEGPRSALREVLVGPGGNVPNPLWITVCAPQWEFSMGEENYVRFRADPVAETLDVAFVNARGWVLFERRYSARG